MTEKQEQDSRSKKTDELDVEEHPNPEKLWRHRRWMAWASLLSVIFIGIANISGFAPQDSSVLQAVIWSLISVVAVYNGGATLVDALAKIRHNRGKQ